MANRFYRTTRYIPQGSLPIEEKDLGVVYVYRSGNKFGAIAYTPKALKSSWHYAFKTDTELDKYIEQWFSGLRAHKQRVANYRTQRFAGHNFKVGDIVTNSWGYDQTNVDWYIVKRISKAYVWLKPVHAQLVDEESHGYSPMAGVESLVLDENLNPIEGSGPETKHQASGDSVTMRHGCGSKWTGDKKYSSWYA